jgi:hypothetical protein
MDLRAITLIIQLSRGICRPNSNMIYYNISMSQQDDSKVLLAKFDSRAGSCQSLVQIDYKKTPWPESASKLYRQSDLRLSAKFVPTFADIECYVVSVTDPYGRILGFLDRSNRL